MAREDVNIKVSANVAEAIRLWKAMEEGPKGMARELGGLGAKGKQAASGMAGEFDKLIGKWASIAGGIAAAKAILDAFIASQREALNRTGESTRSADKFSREIFNLNTPGNKGLDTIRNDMLGLAASRGASPEKAKETMAALLGAGYTYDQVVKGGTADAMLRTLSATNATGKNVDVKGLTDALTAHLTATGQTKTAGNVLGAGQAIQGLFSGTKLELADLAQFAPKSQKIFDATGMGNEQLALASMMKDVTAADAGSTSMAAAITRLVNPKGRALDALKAMGLSRDDVTPASVPFEVIQERLAGGFERAGKVNAGRYMDDIFGNEGAVAGGQFFSRKGIATYKDRLRMMGDTSSFARSVATTEGGYEAKANSAEARSMMAHATEGYVDPEIARKELLTYLKGRKTSAIMRTLAEKAFDTRLHFTSDPESAITAGVSAANLMASPGSVQKRVKTIADAARAETVRVQVELFDQNKVAIPAKKTVKDVEKRSAHGRGGK